MHIQFLEDTSYKVVVSRKVAPWAELPTCRDEPGDLQQQEVERTHAVELPSRPENQAIQGKLEL